MVSKQPVHTIQQGPSTLVHTHNVLCSPRSLFSASLPTKPRFEHIQNASYIKILNACLDINTSVSAQAAAYANARLANEQLDPASLALATAKQDLSRVVGRWMELQNCVCELMDTSTTEKKTEALVRKQTVHATTEGFWDEVLLFVRLPKYGYVALFPKHVRNE